MKTMFVTTVICVAVALFIGGAGYADPNTIYGIHDPDNQTTSITADMATAGVKGWIVFSEEIGHSRDDFNGKDYRKYSNNGYGVIVRLNECHHGTAACDKGYDGTIPYSQYYYCFAQRCANFVANSPGCHIWIIGNEPNYWIEWPGFNGDPTSGQAITTIHYAACYNLCYDAIKAVPGHSTDQVCPAAVCTWLPPIDGGPGTPPGWSDRGIHPFDDYYTLMLNSIGSSKVDGIIMHAYTHGTDPSLIFSEELMTGDPYTDIYYHFRVYKEYMERTPAGLYGKPIYITETDQDTYSWADTDSGWVENAYQEINAWNAIPGNTLIVRCLALYRWGEWSTGEIFRIWDRNNVRQDFRDAMSHNYIWTAAPTADDAGKGIDAGGSVAAAVVIVPASQRADCDPMNNEPNNFYNIGDYAGYVDATDTSDYYKFYTFKGQTITVSMAPPAGNDFDLYLYNPSGTQKGTSLTRTAGAAELVNFTADVTGYWVMRVYRYGGSGTYLFSAALNIPTAAAPTGTIYYPSTNCTCDTSQSGYECTKARDGSTATSWKSAATAGTHWIAFDLGRTRTVKGFQVNLASTAASRARLFKVQTAESLGGTYVDEKLLDNRTAVQAVNCTFPVPKVIQYVRLIFPDCGTVNPLAAEVVDIKPYCSDSTMNTTTPTGNNKASTALMPWWLVFSAADSCMTNECGLYGPQKAHDGSVTGDYARWLSHDGAPPHWIWLDLGLLRTVNGLKISHNGAAGYPTDCNTRAFQIQSAPSYSGPWQYDASITGNAASITYHKYVTAKQARYIRLYITNPGLESCTGYVAVIPEIEVLGAQSNLTEEFTTMPAWTSSYDAPWGNAATWSVVTGGVSGKCLKAVRSGAGSSTKVKTYTVTANTNIHISLHVNFPCGYTGGPYWADCAYKVGTFTATDYETDPRSWTLINRFSDSGSLSCSGSWGGLGVGDYFTVNTLNNTTISIAFRYGTYNCAGPTGGAMWDLMKIN